jgi:hypothetical protein
MKHSAMNKGVMFDWIQTAIDRCDALPTDEQIMDRFGFGTPELARTLLADLADEGKIKIRGTGLARTIELARYRAPGAPVEDPKAEAEVDRTVAKIKDIMERPRVGRIWALADKLSAKAAPPAVAPRPAPAAPPKPKAAPIPKPTATKPKAEELPAAAPAARVDPTHKPGRRQLNIGVTDDLLVHIDAFADARHISRSAAAAQILATALAPAPVEAVAAMPVLGKFKIPARIVAAARDAGKSLDDYLAELVDIGFVQLSGLVPEARAA